MTSYRTETHKSAAFGQKLTIVNMTPERRDDERQAVKRDIETTLYDIFRKYMSNGGL